MMPGDDSQVTLGSTYEQGDSDAGTRPADTQTILARFGQLFDLEPREIRAHAGVRCMTRDRMPVVGRLPDWSSLTTPSSTPTYSSSLLALTGFGSHGATHAPLCAELLAREITGEPTGTWCPRLDPARFRMRELRRTGRA